MPRLSERRKRRQVFMGVQRLEWRLEPLNDEARADFSPAALLHYVG
jgi:hypothetical protein